MKRDIRIAAFVWPVLLVAAAAFWSLGSADEKAGIESQGASPVEPPAAELPPHAAADREEEAAQAPVEDAGAEEPRVGAIVQLPEGEAVVVPSSPGDDVPAPERFDGPAVENDPIEPELPQTPEWKLGKQTHMASLLDRHVERLEGELSAAEASGNREAADKLRVRLQRQRHRLDVVRADAEALREEAEGTP